VQVLYTLSNFKDGIRAFNKEKCESGFDSSVMSYTWADHLIPGLIFSQEII